jgi:hypothetical protein
MALIDTLENALPGWMRREPFFHFTAIALGTAAMVDAMIDGLYEARLAAMPGQVSIPGVPGLGGFDSIEALAKIGRDRRRQRGFTESHADYALRLRRFREDWAAAGTNPGLLNELADILTPDPPRLRLFTAAGQCWTREPDGTLLWQRPGVAGLQYNPDGTIAAAAAGDATPWDWDSTTIPDSLGQGDVGRFWVVIYAPTNAPLDATEGTWGDGLSFYGDTDKTTGTSATSRFVELVRSVVADWKSAGIKVSHVIIAYDPATFDPEDSATYPTDGSWGHHTRLDLGPSPPVKVIARDQSARYWRATAGTAY